MKRADFYDKAGEDGKDNYTTEINSDDLKNIPSTTTTSARYRWRSTTRATVPRRSSARTTTSTTSCVTSLRLHGQRHGATVLRE